MKPKAKNHTMSSQIQRSMNLVLLIALILSFGLMTGMVYSQTLEIMTSEVEQESIYIRSAMNIDSEGYLTRLESEDNTSRITVISPTGKVLYDSVEDQFTMENHKERPEIKEAIANGKGSNLRESNTIKRRTYYYAVMLEDGNILRVSKTMDSVWSTVISGLPYILLIAAAVMFFVWILGKWQTVRLIKPINELDLEHPLENCIYEELNPLLQSMEDQNAEKEKVAQMRKEFTANVSHELKTPLTSISGYAEIMMNGLVKEADMNGFSERIYSEASRLIVLIEDIIELSKLDEASIEFEKEDTEFYSLTREICSRLSQRAENRKVQLEVTGEPVNYWGIRSILDEMLYNIIENAIKYNRQGGHVKIWVGNTLKGPKIVVEDNGIGIPKEDQERIFERFYRVDKSHSKETGGTGLGLSIVKHGALMHHAKINVASEVGKGTRIEILFEK